MSIYKIFIVEINRFGKFTFGIKMFSDWAITSWSVASYSESKSYKIFKAELKLSSPSLSKISMIS